MSARYYHLLPALAASVSLLTAGCGSDRTDGNAAEPPAAAQTAAQTAASSQPDELDTEANIWNVLGLAKRPSQRAKGPQIGNEVSPVLWEASHDALNFVKIASEDPLTGVLLTEWYSPPGADQRLHPVARVALGFGLGDHRSPGASADRAMEVGPDRAGCRR